MTHGQRTMSELLVNKITDVLHARRRMSGFRHDGLQRYFRIQSSPRGNAHPHLGALTDLTADLQSWMIDPAGGELTGSSLGCLDLIKSLLLARPPALRSTNQLGT
jgi:hypothetical protein